MGSKKLLGSMPQPDWLKWYATGICAWQHIRSPQHNVSRPVFARLLGPVESNFDNDGENWCGRADVTNVISLQMPKALSASDIRSRLVYTWSVLRAHHVLLRAKAVDAEDHPALKDSSLEGRCFVIDDIQEPNELLEEAKKFIVFLEDFYDHIDVDLFLDHILNTSRCFKGAECLSKIYVLPLERLPNGCYNVRALLVVAHQIADGISMSNFLSHFTNLLNFTDQVNYRRLEQLGQSEGLVARLPPAQEDVYPQRAPGNLARNRWLWAITRILRHTRNPPAEAFPNPLRREKPRESAQRMPVIFDKVLDYSQTPPLNSHGDFATLSAAATNRLKKLCRDINVSFGAGCFTLAAMTQMLLYEEFNPSVKLEDRLPFVTGFPVNPRPFFNYSNSRDHGSLMLAFSDGITIPFLPSNLPLEGRFKVLARHASRQLKLYQKTPRTEADLKVLGARSASELIPAVYIYILERGEIGRPAELRRGLNPQGEYPPAMSKSGPTCLVTAVGLKKYLMVWEGNELEGREEEDLVKLLDDRVAVRARDREFLVGTAADSEALHIGVSYDGNYIDEKKVERWNETIKGLLEPEPAANL